MDRGKEGEIQMPSLRRSHRLLQGGTPCFVFSQEALSKSMNIKLDRQSETYIREMIRRNRLYGSPSELVSKAIAGFYKQEKKSRFKQCVAHIILYGSTWQYLIDSDTFSAKLTATL